MVRVHRIASSVLITLLLLVSVPLAKADTHADPDVVFNTQSLIYHRASCSAAKRCTKNCVVVKLSEAKERGGRACKICGGPPAIAPVTRSAVSADATANVNSYK
jgi:methylphosphotriester-DNA--protein-cysteine methyltransferase